MLLSAGRYKEGRLVEAIDSVLLHKHYPIRLGRVDIGGSTLVEVAIGTIVQECSLQFGVKRSSHLKASDCSNARLALVCLFGSRAATKLPVANTLDLWL